jgi:hypothetical protein
MISLFNLLRLPNLEKRRKRKNEKKNEKKSQGRQPPDLVANRSCPVEKIISGD